MKAISDELWSLRRGKTTTGKAVFTLTRYDIPPERLSIKIIATTPTDVMVAEKGGCSSLPLRGNPDRGDPGRGLTVTQALAAWAGVRLLLL